MTHFTYDQLTVGQPLLTVKHKVTTEMIQAYGEATGDPHPWHAAGTPAVEAVASPAMATIFSTAVFGHDRPPGDIHAKHEYEMLVPIRAGSIITTTGRVEERYEKRGRKFVVFATSSVDQAGTEVVRCRVTLVVPE